MSADFRHMKRPRQTWFLVYTIPPDLRSHRRFMTANGRPMDKITESLETKDPDKARERRNERLVYWDRQFRMLRHGPSEDDVREEAIEIYRAALKTIAEKRKEAPAAWALHDAWESRPETKDNYLWRLDDAVRKHAAGEIADYCQRIGITLEPKTEPYRK